MTLCMLFTLVTTNHGNHWTSISGCHASRWKQKNDYEPTYKLRVRQNKLWGKV